MKQYSYIYISLIYKSKLDQIINLLALVLCAISELKDQRPTFVRKLEEQEEIT